MMDILKLMYICDLIEGLDESLKIIMAVSCGVFTLSIFGYLASSSEVSCHERWFRIWKKSCLISLFIGITCMIISALIPSKDLRDLYIGTVAVGKAYENEAVKNLTDKVLTLVNQRLDALIEDKKSKGDKHD